MKRAISTAALFVFLVACGSDAESREDLGSQPATPEAPLAEVGSDGLEGAVGSAEARAETTQGTDLSVTAPPAQRRPVTTTPVQSDVVPPPPPTVQSGTETPPPAPVRMIPAGARLTFEVRGDVSTTSNQVGDTFDLVLVDAVFGESDALLPAGTLAKGIVTEARRSTGPEDASLLVVRVSSVEVRGAQAPIEGEVISTDVESSTRASGTRTAATVATGSAAGAMIGRILGRDTRSTVTGAAVGTALGVAVALTTRGGDATLASGTRVVLRLDRDLVF